MRSGVDRHTGQVLTGWPHCRQSIGCVLSTAIGSLLMARDFGCDGDLIDKPMSPPTMARIIVAGAEALRRDEPGFHLTKLRPTKTQADGEIAFDIAGDFYPNALDGDYSIVERDAQAQIAIPTMTQQVL